MAPRFTYSWKFGAGFCPAAGNRNQAFSLPGKTGARCGPTPRKNRVRARHGEERDTERELPTAGAGARCGHAPGTSRVRARLGAGKNTVRDLPGAAALEKPRSKAQLFKRFCALGNVWPHIFLIYGSLGRAFALPQGTGDRLLPDPGKQEPCGGPAPGNNRVRARLGAGTNPVRDLLGAAAQVSGGG